MPFVAAAILTADTLANGYVRLLEQVKYRQVMKKLIGGSVVPATCDFDTEVGTLELDERILETTDLKVDEFVCKDDLRQDWLSSELGPSYLDQDLPTEVTDNILLYLARIAARNNEHNIWKGNFNPVNGGTIGANFTAFDGLLRLIVDSVPLAETTVVGPFTYDTSGNAILDMLETLIQQAPDDIIGDPMTKIYMSRRSLFLLQRAMAGQVVTQGGFSPTFVGDPRPQVFLGYDIWTPAGFSDDTLLMSAKDNLVFGTDLESDYNSATVVDMQQTDASRNVRMSMRFSGGTQFVDEDSLSIVRRSA